MVARSEWRCSRAPFGNRFATPPRERCMLSRQSWIIWRKCRAGVQSCSHPPASSRAPWRRLEILLRELAKQSRLDQAVEAVDQERNLGVRLQERRGDRDEQLLDLLHLRP